MHNQLQKCIKCGNPAEVEHLCRQCYLDSYSNVIGFKDFTLLVCVQCGNYNYGSQFRPALPADGNFIKTIRKAIFENTKFERKPNVFEIEIEFPEHTKKQGTKLNILVNVYVLTVLNQISLDLKENATSEERAKNALVKEEEFQIPLSMRYTVCDKCSIGRSNYFEGRIQIRNTGNSQYEDVINYIRKRIKESKTVFITNEEEHKNGIDFYITSQRFIQNIGNELAKKFGGELNVTASLHTMDWSTSKELYRVDALFKLSDFSKGDIVRINHKLVLVKDVSGRMVTGYDLSHNNQHAGENFTNKEYEVAAKADDVKQAQIISNVVKNVKGKIKCDDAKSKVTNQKAHPDKISLEVLSPIDYQPIKVENPQGLNIDGNTIPVVIIDGKCYGVGF